MTKKPRHGLSDEVWGILTLAWLLAAFGGMPLLILLRLCGSLELDWVWILSPLWLSLFVTSCVVFCALTFMTFIYALGGVVRVDWDKSP